MTLMSFGVRFAQNEQNIMRLSDRQKTIQRYYTTGKKKDAQCVKIQRNVIDVKGSEEMIISYCLDCPSIACSEDGWWEMGFTQLSRYSNGAGAVGPGKVFHHVNITM